jgi:hypothetical protein
MVQVNEASMKTNLLSQNQLARALGISGAMVSKLKQVGMPVHSIHEATAWRQANLNPSLVKEVRRAMIDAPVPATRHQLARAPFNASTVDEVMALAAKAAIAFPDWQAPLRAAMRVLPQSHWYELTFSFGLWELLTAPELRKFEECDQANGTYGPPTREDLDDPADEAGDFIYMIACRMARFKEPDSLQSENALST